MEELTPSNPQHPLAGERARQPIPGAGIDLDPARRPGVPRLHAPRPLPNAHGPPTRQESQVTVFMHGRPHKDFPPVFGTAVPPSGLSGLLRRAAYRYPDHWMRHWTVLLFADRVDAWEHRLRRSLPVVLPALLVIGAGAAWKALSRRAAWAG
ncbi:hypothetical protein [Anaeromyxobacter diazotrophicus]|uniref:Uncharacterized protein n=1 Tax=Anaeromyxobacter diazotrophicus TaxID=2590199 RepID=A0A7I9VJ14_9BACT|nr:hypothetical protein [Anaeromyxobacter diazotrophicus]GEJ56017.1 hypothetical protein AMYX_07580 [Anaeromyxobacter diazotrophicus]